MRVGMRKNRLLGALVKRALPPGVGVPVVAMGREEACYQWTGETLLINGSQIATIQIPPLNC